MWAAVTAADSAANTGPQAQSARANQQASKSLRRPECAEGFMQQHDTASGRCSDTPRAGRCGHADASDGALAQRAGTELRRRGQPKPAC